jgi:hypothetical protein
MFVTPNDIAPSQDYLKPDTVRFIFDCIENWNFDKFPPPPIVRRDEEGKLVAIDGYNIIAVKCFLGEDILVHVAESADDGVEDDSPANKIRNDVLKKKFNTVLDDRKATQAKGIHTFKDLIAKFPDLFPAGK